MTREEAIESLRGILTEAVEFENSVCYVTEEDREPLEMAIKALEHPERNVVAIVPCGDAISRQAVLDIVDSYSESQSNVEDVTQDIISYVVALPSVNPQPYEDAISREPFTDSTICEGISCNECSFNRKDKGGCILEERVMRLPSIQPQPKTGHWIEEETYMECPNCHDIWHYEKNQTERFKFCPTCGGRIE